MIRFIPIIICAIIISIGGSIVYAYEDEDKYEIKIITGENRWASEDDPEVIKAIELKINGLGMYRDYKCMYYEDSYTCSIIIIMQNERMITQQNIIIEQNERIISLLSEEKEKSWLDQLD